ncbi:MAG: permease [Rhizobiales bacterium]|nr:permease [Hyphomicrobiales bacterium]
MSATTDCCGGGAACDCAAPDAANDKAGGCGCGSGGCGSRAASAPPIPQGERAFAALAATATALVVWWLVYRELPAAADWLAERLPVAPGSHAYEAARFFFYDAPKVLMLLALVVFAMGVVRSWFSPERTRRLLAGRREGVGNVAAAGLGVLTPFCSCSAIPLFLGFVSAGVPLGVTFSFLIAAPMVNEIALGLLFALLGWKVAAVYLVFGLAVAIVAGWIIGRLSLDGWLEGWVRDLRASAADAAQSAEMTIVDRLRAGLDAVRDIVGRVWIWVLAGIAVGALIHGYVPAESLAAMMGKDAWWSVPAAVLVGVPMYANAAGVVPVVEALLGKGAALGTVLAFMMSVIALSAPELLILRKVLTPKLIAVFVAVVATGIVAVGYLFNLLFA